MRSPLIILALVLLPISLSAQQPSALKPLLKTTAPISVTISNHSYVANSLQYNGRCRIDQLPLITTNSLFVDRPKEEIFPWLTKMAYECPPMDTASNIVVFLAGNETNHYRLEIVSFDLKNDVIDNIKSEAVESSEEPKADTVNFIIAVVPMPHLNGLVSPTSSAVKPILSPLVTNFVDRMKSNPELYMHKPAKVTMPKQLKHYSSPSNAP